MWLSLLNKPTLALLIHIFNQLQSATWELLGIVLPKAMSRPNPVHFVGALGTYLGGLGLSVGLLIRAIAG